MHTYRHVKSILSNTRRPEVLFGSREKTIESLVCSEMSVQPRPPILMPCKSRTSNGLELHFHALCTVGLLADTLYLFHIREWKPL